MTGYPVELMGSGTSNLGRGRSLSMSSIRSKSTPHPTKILKRSQSLKTIDVPWQIRIERARSEDNIHRKESEGMLEEAHGKNNNNDVNQPTTKETNVQKPEKPGEVEGASNKTTFSIPNFVVDQHVDNRHLKGSDLNTRDGSRSSHKTTCEGIEEERKEDLEAETEKEGDQSTRVPSHTQPPDDIGTVDAEHASSANSSSDGDADGAREAENSSCCGVQDDHTPTPNAQVCASASAMTQSTMESAQQSYPTSGGPSGFPQFAALPGAPPGPQPQAGFQFPPGCVIIMNGCNNIQFGNNNTINSTQHNGYNPMDKLAGLNQEMMRMLISLTDPEKERQMVNDLQGEDKRKELVSGLKELGTQLNNATQGCVLLDFALPKEPEERLRFLRSCQSGKFQKFIQDKLLSYYVEDPTKVSMVLCFSIASITDTGCEHMAFNFNLLQGKSEVAPSSGLEGLRHYATLSGLHLVDNSSDDLLSVVGEILTPEQRNKVQDHLKKNVSGEVAASEGQATMGVLAEVLQRPVRLITALESSLVDVLIFPSQTLSSTIPVAPLVIGAYDGKHYVTIDYVIPVCPAPIQDEVPLPVETSTIVELNPGGDEGGVEEGEGTSWEKTDGGYALRLETSINDPLSQKSLPNKGDQRWADLTTVTFTDCTVELKDTEGTLALEVRYQNKAQDLATLQSVLSLFPQRSKVSKICLGGNKIREIPDGIGLLPNLKYLSAPKNKLKKIPGFIPDVTNLTVIDLNRNHLTKFPEALQFMPQLKKLCLCFNKIRSIPAGILSNMKNLKTLAMDRNNLKGLPQDIVQCESLSELYIRGNPLSSLPRVVFSISSLGLLGVDRKVWEGFLKHNDDTRYRPSFHRCFDGCQHMSYDKRRDAPEASQEAGSKLTTQLEEERPPKERCELEEAEPSIQEYHLEQNQEEPPIFPSAEMSLTAHVSSMDDYNATYRASIEDPSEFWREISKEFHWETEPTGKFVEHNFDPNAGDVFVRWMPGATTNITYNLLEKNIREEGLGSSLALQWQGDDDVETREVTYAQLKSLVCRASNMLKAKGIEKGHRVMIYMPQTIEQAVAMLACARIGAVHCVVYGGATAEYLADRVKDSKCTAIITADFAWKDGGKQGMKSEVDRALKLCGEEHFVRSCIVVRRADDPDDRPQSGAQETNVPWCEGRDYWWQEEMERVSDECEPEWMDAEDPLLIIYTSGSTGSPKGVIHTVGGYMMYTATTFKYVFDCGNVTNRVHFCTADLGWVTGQSYVIYGPLLNGVTTVLLEGDPLKPDRIVSMVRQYKVTSLYTTPTAIRHMKATSKADTSYKLDTLRVIGTVGEPIAKSTWRWCRSTVGGDRCSVVDTYWQTETGGHVMTPLPGATPMKPGFATLPFFGVEPAVLTDDGREMEGPCEGHMVFKSPWPGMMRGINGKPEKFASYFQQFPGYYYTGDRCRRDSDGYYRILGRREDRVSIPGAMGKVFNQLDVEATLLQHPDVKEVAVVTADPSSDDKEDSSTSRYDNWYIFVTLRQTASLTKTILSEMLATTLHIFTPPSRIHCAEELPRTWSDKVIRRFLRKVVLNDLDLGDFHVVANLKSLPVLFRQCVDMQNSCQPKADLFTKAKIMPS